MSSYSEVNQDKIAFRDHHHQHELVNNDIRGLIDSVNDGSTSAFMWEWFTTKPFVDAGEARFVSGSEVCGVSPSDMQKIGSVPTPWSSWLIAAHPSRARAPEQEVNTFLETLTQFVRSFDSAASRADADVEYIQTHFGYPAEDIKVTTITSSSWNY